MSIVAERTDSADSVEDLLLALRARGYHFIAPGNEGGEVVAVVGVRAHDNVIDVIRLNGEDDATATRMPGDELHILAPAPERVLWQYKGMAIEVLAELLALPDDRTPGSIITCR